MKRSPRSRAPLLSAPGVARYRAATMHFRLRTLTGLAALTGSLLLFVACSQEAKMAGSPSESTASTNTTTTTSPPETTGPVISGFVTFGDFGGGPQQLAVAAAMERWVANGHRVDALTTTGDNVYERGEPTLFATQLDDPYRTLRKTRPLWVTLGNHDVTAGHGNKQLRHLDLPNLPYAKELPGVQLLFLDANRPDVSQTRWLAERLREDGPKFRIALFHQPAVSCGFHGSTVKVGELWMPLFESYKVALVLSGHDHHYERFLSNDDVTYVVTGGGGRKLYPYLPNCKAEPKEQAGAMRHHFVGIEVRKNSLTLTAVADDDTVLDQATITRTE